MILMQRLVYKVCICLLDILGLNSIFTVSVQWTFALNDAKYRTTRCNWEVFLENFQLDSRQTLQFQPETADIIIPALQTHRRHRSCKKITKYAKYFQFACFVECSLNYYTEQLYKMFGCNMLCDYCAIRGYEKFGVSPKFATMHGLHRPDVATPAATLLVQQ